MQLQDRTLRRLHILAAIGYYACWVSACAAIAWLSAVILWESRAGDLLPGVDDDWTLLMLPAGAFGGAWAARRTARARRFQRGCLPVGLGLVLVGLVLALVMFGKAQELSGGGHFAGLGEAIMGLFFLIAAGLGLLISGIGAAGMMRRAIERKLDRSTAEPETGPLPG